MANYSSPLWENVSLSEKERLSVIETKDDGEFFMSFDDFLTYFNILEICFTHPNDMICVKDKSENCCTWKLDSFNGKWIEGVTAGGCINNQGKNKTKLLELYKFLY